MILHAGRVSLSAHSNITMVGGVVKQRLDPYQTLVYIPDHTIEEVKHIDPNIDAYFFRNGNQIAFNKVSGYLFTSWYSQLVKQKEEETAKQ